MHIHSHFAYFFVKKRLKYYSAPNSNIDVNKRQSQQRGQADIYYNLSCDACER